MRMTQMERIRALQKSLKTLNEMLRKREDSKQTLKVEVLSPLNFSGQESVMSTSLKIYYVVLPSNNVRGLF